MAVSKNVVGGGEWLVIIYGYTPMSSLYFLMVRVCAKEYVYDHMIQLTLEQLFYNTTINAIY